MNSIVKLFFFLVFSLPLAACQPVSVTPNIFSPTPEGSVVAQSTQVVQLDQPTQTEQSEQPIDTPTITLTPAPPTQMPAPGKTSAPSQTPTPSKTPTPSPTPTNTIVPTPAVHPLTIEYLHLQTYQSKITFEIKLDSGENYDQFIVSYPSEGLKIFALLTIPIGDAPPTGWPVIVFNHGYIPHYEYTSTGYYEQYVEAFASAGYIVLMPDYRGHGESEGEALGVYSVPDYTIDVLNAVSAIKGYRFADPDRMGMWGHSMGGYITLRAMVVDPDIKAGVIWGGVVASYADLCEYWFKCGDHLSGKNFADSSGVMAAMGPPTESPDFWSAASANTYLSELNTPLQLHHSEYDKTVPAKLSRILYDELIAIDAEVELYLYPSTDHNIATYVYFDEAMQRTLDFFKMHLK